MKEMDRYVYAAMIFSLFLHIYAKQRTIDPENAHLKPDLGALSHHEMTLTLNTHTFTDLIIMLFASARFRSQTAIASKASDF